MCLLFFGAGTTRHKPMCLGLCCEALIGGIKLGQHFTYKRNTTLISSSTFTHDILPLDCPLWH
jgi:hypothetical protein